MKNKRKLFSMFVLNILLISSCYGINEYNGLKFLNSNNSSVEESSNEDFSFGIEDHYYCDFSDVSHYDGRLEHKYYIYTDLIKNDNESVTFDKTGDLNFKITFYHQLDKYFFIKRRHSNMVLFTIH